MSRILIIDDDLDFLMTMQAGLGAHGFQVETAPTPEEGMRKLAGSRPDLVILDVLMPTGFEGFDLANAIRQEPGMTDLPILMLSNVHSVKEAPYRFAPDKEYLPVDVFLDKPVDLETLVGTIQEMLGTRREQPEHPL
jgi:CheY-like chemotaxis protein